jgi:hypothetical protein
VGGGSHGAEVLTLLPDGALFLGRNVFWFLRKTIELLSMIASEGEKNESQSSAWKKQIAEPSELSMI